MFVLFLGLFWALFLLILGVLGRHFGSQKVDANFDRKTGMQVNPANPGKSRHGGSKSPENYQQDLPWTARPPEALHIVAEARWRIFVHVVQWKHSICQVPISHHISLSHTGHDRKSWGVPSVENQRTWRLLTLRQSLGGWVW